MFQRYLVKTRFTEDSFGIIIMVSLAFAFERVSNFRTMSEPRPNTAFERSINCQLSL